MDYTLIPICSQLDHKIIMNIFGISENNCGICNKYNPAYCCSNCDYYRCLKCQIHIEDENNKIIQSMKNTLNNKINDIKKEYNSQISYCKKTGNIYINSGDGTFTKYPHEDK